MNDSDRISRPTPGRAAPIRNSWTGPATGGGNPQLQDAPAHEVAAHAVRVGYQVIGENIRQGRIAADRFSAGDYGVRDVPNELTQLSARLLQLTRDLSTTAFDFMGAVLRDPALRDALQPRAQGPAGTPAGTPEGAPKGFPEGGGQGGPPKGTPAAGNAVPLTYNIRGSANATGTTGVLRHPEQPTRLTVAGLWSPDPALPPLRGVSFAPAADGYGVVATIDIPDGHPPGTYNGVVCDGRTHQPLGTMTVRVVA